MMKSRSECPYCGHDKKDHDARWTCWNEEPCLCKAGRLDRDDVPRSVPARKGLGCAAAAAVPALLAIVSIWLQDWRFVGIGAVLAGVIVVVLMVVGIAAQEVEKR